MNKRYDYDVDYIIIVNVFLTQESIQLIIDNLNIMYGLRAYIIESSCICLNLSKNIINDLTQFFESKTMPDRGNTSVIIRKMDECEAPTIESKINVLSKLVITTALNTLQPVGVIDHGWYKVRMPHISF